MAQQEFIAKALSTLCEQNCGKGAVFRAAGSALSLVESAAGLDQDFLDWSLILWRSGAGAAARTDGRLSLFPVSGGAVVLDAIDEAACPPGLRALLLEGIGNALESLKGDRDDAATSGERLPNWLEVVPEDELERQRLTARLRAADWCVASVARREGMSRRGLYYKLQRLGIARPKPT